LKKVFSLPSFLFVLQKESVNPPRLLLLSRRRKRGGSQDFKQNLKKNKLKLKETLINTSAFKKNMNYMDLFPQKKINFSEHLQKKNITPKKNMIK